MATVATYIQYFIPHDGDTEEHPNVFVVNQPASLVTMADIVSVRGGRHRRTLAAHASELVAHCVHYARCPTQCFPLPGSYFFRFKQPHGKTYGAFARPRRAAPRRTHADPCAPPRNVQCGSMDQRSPRRVCRCSTARCA
jgi:hypothetical protein